MIKLASCQELMMTLFSFVLTIYDYFYSFNEAGKHKCFYVYVEQNMLLLILNDLYVVQLRDEVKGLFL